MGMARPARFRRLLARAGKVVPSGHWTSPNDHPFTPGQDNLAPVTTRARSMDSTNPVKELIIRDETVTFLDTPGTGRLLTAPAPDRDEIHIFLTNEMTLPPGVLSE